MKRPLVPSDLYRIAFAGDPRLLPQGRVVYVRGALDEERDEAQTSVWIARAGEAARALTHGTKDRMPRPSPAGKDVAFVADRGEGTRIYLLPLEGGEARPVSPVHKEIGGLVWSPDGSLLAYTARTERERETARIFHDEKSGARHIRALPFKSDDDGLFDGTRRHLFVLDPFAAGEPVRLTHGDFDVQTPCWSADGRKLAFAAQIDAPEWSFFSDIYVLDRGDGTMRNVTGGLGPMIFPAFSHDGREIAFLGHLRGDDTGGRFNPELLVVDLASGAIRSLSSALDRPVGDFVICDMRGAGGMQPPAWSEDDAEVFVLVSSEGTSGVRAFRRDGSGVRTVLGGERDVFAFSRDSSGAIAFAYSDPLTPCDVALLDERGVETRLTRGNAWLDERTIRAPRRFRPRTDDGATLDLFVLEPDEPRGAPLVLQVHGGPHTAYGFAFFFEFQMLAAHGIGVAYGNPRGSQTYGGAYADAITGDWGGRDAADVLALLDAAEEHGEWDRARIGLAGGSYGGFMTTWLLGHSSRFAAGISMRAVNDFVSEVGAADIGWFLERELNASWEDDGRQLFEGSPMRAARRIDVPLLIEHSERDYRCPIDQAEQIFALLRRLGRTAEFVRFTGDGHNLSRSGKPRNRVLRLRAIAHWLIRYLHPRGIVPVGDHAGSLFEPLATEADPSSAPAARLEPASIGK